MRAIREHADRLIVIAGGAAGNIEKATRDLDEQEKAEAQSLTATTAGMVQLTRDADKVIADPELEATIKNLSITTKHLGEVSDNAAKLSDFYYRKLTSPVTLARKIGESAAYYLSVAGGAALAVLR
jgi:glyceraldehyde-3-phosphate dehydrogenase/erythrose-4-phosphate dehydrogenase